MVTALIIINQSGKPPGSPGTSRDDLSLGTLVVLTNNDNTGVTSWLWEFESRPVGSSATLSGAATPTATFTPDVVGSYMVKLTVDAPSVELDTDSRIGAVKTPFLDMRKPATGEQLEFDATDGWSAAMQALLDTIDADAANSLKADATVPLNEVADPTPQSNKGFIYAKDASGTTELFYEDSNGSVTQLTFGGTLNVSLDSAYDFGGAGAGRTVAVDSGPILLNVSGDDIGLHLQATGNLDQNPILKTEIASDINSQQGVYFRLAADGYTHQQNITSDLVITNMPSGGFNAIGILSSILVGPPFPGDDEVIAYQAMTIDPGGPVDGKFIAYDVQSNGSGEFDYALRADYGDILLQTGNLDLVDGYAVFGEQSSDPPYEANRGSLFTKDIGGVTALFYIDDDGDLSRLDGYVGVHNTLDQAYDQGGAGVGRTITADNGPVEITSTATGLKVNFNPPAGFEEGIEVVSDHGGASDVFGIKSTITAGSPLSALEKVAAFEALILDSTAAPTAVLSAFRASHLGTNGVAVAYDTNPGDFGWEYVLRGFGGSVLLQGDDGYLTMRRVSPTPGGQGSGLGTVYVGLDVADEELFFQDGSGNYPAVQLTHNGAVNVSLDSAYGEGRVITVDVGPVELNASGDAALELDGYLVLDEISDPDALGNSGLVYTKDVSGTTELFYRDSDGTIVQLTGGGSIAGNTLDQAYDEGGAGVGRTITADSGPVAINASGADALELDGYLTLKEISAPTALGDSGIVHVKDVSGVSELYYTDSSGNVVRLTQGGNLVDHASTHLRGSTDEIDGDKLDIDWDPTHYVPTTDPSEVDNVDELTAHLAGIDGYLLDLGNGVADNAADLSAHEGNTANPHATDIGNLGSGTLAELNSAVSDATLFDRSELDGYADVDHDATHIRGGSDEVDGDKLDIDWTPANYVPSTDPAEVDNADELTAHLAGIDGYLLDLGNGVDDNAADLATHEADTANPHATDIGNLGSGTLAELNVAVTDATLFDRTELDGYAAADHDVTHIRGGDDEIDGDKLDIDWSPANYVPNTDPAEVDNADELTAHLAGIDGYLLDLGNGVADNAVDLVAHEIDVANPHSTDVGNLGSGTLAELNSALTDATLVDGEDGYSGIVQVSSTISLDITNGLITGVTEL